MTRIIALSGGRNAVGKTTIAVQLATHLAAAGQRVCLLELVTDANAASRLLKAPVAATLSDRLAERNAGEKLAASVPQGFDLVVAGGGRDWLRDLSAEQLGTLSDTLLQLQGYDFLLIDAGIDTDQNHLAFSLASPEMLLVITPEPESRSDAYALLKLLYAEQYDGSVSVLVNKSPNDIGGRRTYEKFREIASFYLDMDPPLAGLIGGIAKAGTPSADMQNLASSLLALDARAQQRDMASFCRQLLQAAGAVAVVDVEPEFTPVFAAPQPQYDLHEQLAQLSAQVDELIAEVERLRRDETGQAAAPAGRHHAPAAANTQRFGLASMAAIANRSERVTVAGETFAIYHMRTAGGRQQRFACQSIDDDLEEPEPQTRLS